MDRPRFSIRLYPSVVISSVVVLLGTASLNNARGQGFYTHPALPNGHKVVGPPAAASWGRGRLDVVVTGEDGLVYHRYYAANASGPAEGWEATRPSPVTAEPSGHRPSPLGDTAAWTSRLPATMGWSITATTANHTISFLRLRLSLLIPLLTP